MNITCAISIKVQLYSLKKWKHKCLILYIHLTLFPPQVAISLYGTVHRLDSVTPSGQNLKEVSPLLCVLVYINRFLPWFNHWHGYVSLGLIIHLFKENYSVATSKLLCKAPSIQYITYFCAHCIIYVGFKMNHHEWCPVEMAKLFPIF